MGSDARAHKAQEPSEEEVAIAVTGRVQHMRANIEAKEKARLSSTPQSIQSCVTADNAGLTLAQGRLDTLRQGQDNGPWGDLEAAATAVESLRARAESAAAAGRAAQSALVASSTENNDVVGIGMRLSHARKLASAYPRTEPYTNLAGNDFVATLDWILHEKDALTTRAVAPIPDLDEVRSRHFPLPSEAFPSDHVCLVADLDWS